MNTAEAIATVGVAFAVAFAFVGFFWTLSISSPSPSDYKKCLMGCKDGWGNYNNLECPEMCLPISENYNIPNEVNKTVEEEVDGGTDYGCYTPPDCYSNREDFLEQFPNQTFPNSLSICWYYINCAGFNNSRWWKSPYE